MHASAAVSRASCTTRHADGKTAFAALAWPGFEEASRALFANDHVKLAAVTGKWPPDARAHVARLLGAAAPPKPRG